MRQLLGKRKLLTELTEPSSPYFVLIHLKEAIWRKKITVSFCACSLEYSSLSTLAGLSYHICGKLEVAFKAQPSSQHQHCTDEAQKQAETVLSAVIYIYIW